MVNAESAPLLPLAFGWHGKLPTRGDFVGRGLPRAWLRGWDDWVQRAMADASRRIDAVLLRERLLGMSPWHFVALPESVAPPRATVWTGVVLPSTDRVGRAFPLLFAQSYDLAAAENADLDGLHEQAIELSHWLRAGIHTLSAAAFDQSASQWGHLPWPVDSATTDSPDPHETLARLRQREPTAASFWWRLDHSMSEVGVLAEPWPPRESLLLEWLAVSD